jgi:hypothetical protein
LFVDILKKFRVEETVADGNLTKNQKLAVFGLAVLGIVILIFWAIGMKNNIYLPFNLPVSQNVDFESCPNGNCADVTINDSRDTDGDGLSDWEESNIYQTSPYIDDTDSDGISDGDEVRAGSNPNCPRGQACDSVNGATDPSSTNQPPGESEVDFEEIYMTEDQVNNNQVDLNKVFVGQADAATLRRLLIESGVKKEDLDQMTDEQLMSSYFNTLQSAMESGDKADN